MQLSLASRPGGFSPGHCGVAPNCATPTSAPALIRLEPAYPLRTSSEYCCTHLSSDKKTIGSTIAWATSARSKGSLWSGGKVATRAACVLRKGSSPMPASIELSRSLSGPNASKPLACLMATSQIEMAEKYTELPGSAIAERRVGPSLGSSVAHQIKT